MGEAQQSLSPLTVAAMPPDLLSTQRTPDLPSVDKLEQRSALLSPDGVYRYLLARIWAPGPRVLYIGLNPSTADANNDDPTVNWWRAFAKRIGYGGFVAGNLYAYRTSSPKKLAAEGYPVGPNNDEALLEAAKLCDLIVACWGGSTGRWTLDRGRDVARLFQVPLYCFGVNANGTPRHPLARGTNKLSPETAELSVWTCP